MNEFEMIGWLIVAITTLSAFVYAVTRPFSESSKERKKELQALKAEQDEKNAKLEQRVYKLNEQIKKEVQDSNKELIHSINELTITMKLFNQTLEGWQEIFRKQDEFNDEIEMEIQSIKDDLKDFKHNCAMVHKVTEYYKESK